MAAMNHVFTLGPDGCLHLRVNRSPGARLRVLIEDVAGVQEAIEIMNIEGQTPGDLSEPSAFVRDVLANPAEDVWNDL
jgi:hypothetical protein